MSNPHPGSAAPRRTFAVPAAPPTGKADPFHGQELLARMASRFIAHLFIGSDVIPSNSPHSPARLPYFVAYALHRTKLNPAVLFACLALLQRLKARFPAARGSSGHRLFISSYMISSKVMCDDTYSNKSWSVVAQGLFTLREINQMEREMCTYLDWELVVTNPMLAEFEQAVRKDFSFDRPQYPTYPTTMVSKRAKRAEGANEMAGLEKSSTTSPVPGFAQKNNTPPTPTKPWGMDSNTPDTPSPTFSSAASPTSSGSPATPIGGPDPNPKVRGVDLSPEFKLNDDARPNPSVQHPLKPKMYAFAAPSNW